MGKYTNASAGYPVFSISNGAVHAQGGERGQGRRPALLNVGGGGAARSGIKNCVTLFSIEHNEKGEPGIVPEVVFDTGAKLATSAEVSDDGRFVCLSVGGGAVLLAYDAAKRSMDEVAAWDTDNVADPDVPPCQNVARFCPSDSTLVATGGDGGRVCLWRLSMEATAALAARAEEKGVELTRKKAGAAADLTSRAKNGASRSKDDAGPADGEGLSDGAGDAGESDGDGADAEIQQAKEVGDDASSAGEPGSAEEGHAGSASGQAPDDAASEAASVAADVAGDGEGEAEKGASVSSLEHELAGHTKAIKDVAFDPTGSLLATASADNTCRLWDVATGKLVQLLPSDAAAGMAYRRCRFVGEDRLVTLQAKPGRGGHSFVVEFVRDRGGSAGKQWGLGRSVLVFKGLATTMQVHPPFMSVGDARGGVTLLDLDTLEILSYFAEVHNLPITGLSSLPGAALDGGTYIVSGSMDKTLTMIPARRPRFRGLSRVLLPVAIVLLILLLRVLLLTGGDEDGSEKEL